MSIGTDWWFVGVLLEQWGGCVCVWSGGMNELCARVGVRFVGFEVGAAAAVWVSAPPGLGKRRGCAASLRDPVGVLVLSSSFAFSQTQQNSQPTLTGQRQP
nr:hypothetical protein CFP56_39440 [Quercus suber]